MERVIVNTNEAPAAVGPYSQAVKKGNMLFVSGQIPLVPGTGELVEGDIQAQTKQAMENVKAVLAAGGASLNDVVKTTVFITSMSDFPLVNEIYAQYFQAEPPARACVEVSALPKGANVEVEAVAIL